MRLRSVRAVLSTVLFVVALAAIGAAVVSAVRIVEWATKPADGEPQYVFGVTRGCLVYWWYEQPDRFIRGGWNVQPSTDSWQWLPAMATTPNKLTGYIELPLWMVALPLVGVAAAIAPRKKRREAMQVT